MNFINVNNPNIRSIIPVVPKVIKESNGDPINLCNISLIGIPKPMSIPYRYILGKSIMYPIILSNNIANIPAPIGTANPSIAEPISPGNMFINVKINMIIVIGINTALIRTAFFRDFVLFLSNFTIPILELVIYFFPSNIINGAGGITTNTYQRDIISLSIGASANDNNKAPYAIS